MNKILLGILGSFILVMSCKTSPKKDALGNPLGVETIEYDEKAPLAVIKDTIPSFSLTNQEGETITNETFKDKIYVTDFFFTRCPTQCPAMKAQMLRIYNKYKDNDKIVLLSHSIDPKNDTVQRLKNFADRLQVNAPKWHFVTGERAKIKKMAKAYYIPYEEDADEPGGYLHSKRFILMDGKGRMRGSCSDGTNPDETDIFLKDIEKLLNEKEE